MSECDNVILSSGTDFQSRRSISKYFGDTFLLQTHSSQRENMNMKIKDTVVLKNKINIFMDESMNRNVQW